MKDNIERTRQINVAKRLERDILEQTNALLNNDKALIHWQTMIQLAAALATFRNALERERESTFHIKPER